MSFFGISPFKWGSSTSRSRLINHTPAILRFNNETFPCIDHLELRELPASYSLLPGAWTLKDRITYSIPADGVFWYQGTNNFNSMMATKVGADWKLAIAEAMSTWSSQSDLDIAYVTDANVDGDYYAQRQGDALFGDIRIGGFDFNNSQVMAVSYGPPPHGWTKSGDLSMNTALNWGYNQNYDLETVILHEVGHSLGLGHPSDTESIMYEKYQGVRQSLSANDIKGIQSLYGTRREDSFSLAGKGVSVAQPIEISKPVAGGRTASFVGLELASTGAQDFIAVTVPENFVGTSLTVRVSAKSISMLSPMLSLVGNDGNVIRSISSPGQWGAAVELTLGTVLAGEKFVFKIQSAERERFAIGGYGVSLEYTGGTIVTSPVAPVTPVVPPVSNPPVVPIAAPTVPTAPTATNSGTGVTYVPTAPPATPSAVKKTTTSYFVPVRKVAKVVPIRKVTAPKLTVPKISAVNNFRKSLFGLKAK